MRKFKLIRSSDSNARQVASVTSTRGRRDRRARRVATFSRSSPNLSYRGIRDRIDSWLHSLGSCVYITSLTIRGLDEKLITCYAKYAAPLLACYRPLVIFFYLVEWKLGTPLNSLFQSSGRRYFYLLFGIYNCNWSTIQLYLEILIVLLIVKFLSYDFLKTTTVTLNFNNWYFEFYSCILNMLDYIVIVVPFGFSN